MNATQEHEVADLCRRYGASILRRCRGILKDPTRAEDAAQEVYLMLLRKGDSFNGDAQVSTWLYRVTTNVCLNQLRSNKRTQNREDDNDVVDWHHAPARNPLDSIAQKDQLEKLLTLMDPLNQQIFTCRYLDGLRQEEIAEVCQTSRKTVGKRLLQIRALLEDVLRDRLDEENSSSLFGGAS
ncbi:MAG: RNA polymerase sigma factor [Deltaproteobacteria bacterium]|nr:RNA polymerase sigma factor [Deltaproteobacteria bacterium]